MPCSASIRQRALRVVSLPERNAAVRQILGRAGEVWVPESGTDHLMVYRWK